MRGNLCDKGSVRGWDNRTRFVYTTKFGRISEHGSDINKLCDIVHWFLRKGLFINRVEYLETSIRYLFWGCKL